ncbi:TonB-dependent receptor [uncultured Alistipes sp.]|uniref:TonB-dependent receptor n=1 Tax=uncultured Alistipes sp. TaxID=538949 RepID=UPI002595D8A3|nr:TonB-dependent receptor [uncultured Alistipes sp.]
MNKIPLLAALLLAFPVRASLPADTHAVTEEERPRPIDSVVVTGARYRADVRHLPMTVSTVGRGRIEQSHEPSLLPLLTEQVPGLFATGRGIMGYSVSTGAAGQMSLRGIGGAPQAGLPTTGLMVLIDGHPQYMGLMGHPIADACQSMLTERVEVLRGPASVLYGSNAMGGVVNIVTRKSKDDGVRTGVHIGYGSYNTLQTEATNRVKLKRFSSVVTGSYNRTDGHRPRMGFEQYGGYAKAGCEIASAWNIEADVNLTHFNASNPGSVAAPVLDNDSHITRGMTSLALRNEYERTSGALSFFYNWGRHKIDDGYSPGSEPLDYRFHSRDEMLGISWYQSARLFEGNRLTLGFDWFRFGGRAWNQPLDGSPRSMLADKTLHEVAAYMDFRQTIGSWLTLDAGLRIDHHSHVGTEWVPQAGISFLPSNSAEIKLSASKGFRYPTIREMYMFPPQNPDLKPERLWSYEIAWSQRVLDGRISFGVNVFYIDGENLIMRVPVDGRPKNINTGKIENAGAEAQFAWRISPAWSLDANYSYLHMAYPVLASPEHKFHVGAAFARGRWNVSTGVQYVGGLYTEVKVNGSGRSTQENFVLWNLRGSFRVCKVVELFVRGENLLAQRYEINAGYPMPKATVLGGVNLHF